MRSVKLVVGCALFATIASGCTKSKSKTRTGEESVSSTAATAARPSAEPSIDGGAAPSCGHEVQVHGRGYDEAARTCLWDAYVAAKPAELALTRHTIEGDPITFTLRVSSSSSIEVIEDNRDRFGARGVRRSTCTKLERGVSVESRRGFIVSGCSGAAEKVEIP